jgi:hypothetical protein
VTLVVTPRTTRDFDEIDAYIPSTIDRRPTGLHKIGGSREAAQYETFDRAARWRSSKTRVVRAQPSLPHPVLVIILLNYHTARKRPAEW